MGALHYLRGGQPDGALPGSAASSPAHVRPAEIAAREGFLPPASFAKGFKTRGYSPGQIDLFVAQFRRDKARLQLRTAEKRATHPNLDPAEREAAEAKRDKLDGVHQGFAETYENMWPGDHPAPSFEESTIPKAQREKKARPTRQERAFARRLRIVTLDSTSSMAKTILQKYPEVAAAYAQYQNAELERQDVQRAHELAQSDTIYCNSRMIPGLQENWQLLDVPLQIIVTGLTHLLAEKDTMLIEDAEGLLDKEIQALSQTKDNPRLGASYFGLKYQWPHIAVLHNRGKIETAAGALTYYSALQERFRENPQDS